MRRVVVTGRGVVSAAGIGLEAFWDGLLRGESKVRHIAGFDATDFPVRIAAEVPEFDPERCMDRREVPKTDRFIQFALAAAVEAAAEAGLAIEPAWADRVGVAIGSGIGGLATIEKNHDTLRERGPRRVSPFFIPSLIINLAAGQVSLRLGARGPNTAVSTACATGTHAIGDAFEIIRRGAADAMIAGGAEACVTPLAVAGFAAMRALSQRNDDPEHASRPFDRERDGFVIGEGAGVLVLEELEFARRRGARILAEVLGYGMSGDAHHITAPSPGGEGAVRAMRAALDEAGLPPAEVDYVNAHGTSTQLNDLLETQALKTVFGEHAYKLAISATKSMIGHLLGAAGAVEMVATVTSIERGAIHPTANLVAPDPECDLDFVPGQARRRPVRLALSNSFGFGGTNATLLVGRHPLDR